MEIVVGLALFFILLFTIRATGMTVAQTMKDQMDRMIEELRADRHEG